MLMVRRIWFSEVRLAAPSSRASCLGAVESWRHPRNSRFENLEKWMTYTTENHWNLNRNGQHHSVSGTRSSGGERGETQNGQTKINPMQAPSREGISSLVSAPFCPRRRTSTAGSTRIEKIGQFSCATQAVIGAMSGLLPAWFAPSECGPNLGPLCRGNGTIGQR